MSTKQMKELTHIQHVSPTQIAFGARFGIDLTGDTVSVARAKIDSFIDHEFQGLKLERPTDNQVKLARKFGFDISGAPRRVGDKILDDIMQQLNHEAIASEKLTKGVVVIHTRDITRREKIISSISPSGTVFFKGGNGQKAVARNVRRIKQKS